MKMIKKKTAMRVVKKIQEMTIQRMIAKINLITVKMMMEVRMMIMRIVTTMIKIRRKIKRSNM